MTAQTTSRCEHCLVACVEDAHDHALEAVGAHHVLDAVVWMSAHLAATQRTIATAARRVPAARPLLAEQVVVDRRLERILRIAEQRHSGDALAAGLDEQRLDVVLQRAVAGHARVEHRLLNLLADTLTDDDAAALAEDYGRVLEHAPTRPHPHAPHGRVLGAAAFRIDGWRDRVMDTLDSRHVPAPRAPRPTVAPGRWGRYLLGEMER